jgi:hypothetical protein
MSPSGHPTFEQLDRLAANRLATEEEAQTVLRHLLVRCERCHGYLEHRLDRGPDPGPDSGPNPGPDPIPSRASAWDSWRGRRAAEDEPMDRLLATGLWAALEGRAQAQRLRMVSHDPRFHEPALVERLIEAGRESRVCDPRGAREIAELAVAVAEHLDPRAHPQALAGDRRAAALANLGDAQRRCEELAAAERSFARAWRSLDEGSGDALERANVMRLEASLRLARGDRERGMRRLRSAASIYGRCGDLPEQARVVLQMAQACGHRDPWRGVALAREALTLIAGQEPRLELSARHALIWFLNDGGAGRAALALLESSRPLYRQIEGSQPRFYQKWLEGRIARSLGGLAAAEETLKTVWRDFRGAGFNLDLTLVSLDLAEIFLAQGKTRHAVLLLRRFEPTLRLFKMHSHGMAAWLLLREALATEAARVPSLLREAALYYRQAWRRPVPFRRRR